MDELRFRATVRHDGAEVGDLPWLEEFWAVRYDDYAALQARVAELEAERDASVARWAMMSGRHAGERDNATARAEAAEALLSEAVQSFRAITELEATGYSKAKAINLAADLARKAIASIVKENRG